VFDISHILFPVSLQNIMTTSCVQGEVLDYQLCVNYEKEQETYPLIGDDTHTELTYFLKQM